MYFSCTAGGCEQEEDRSVLTVIPPPRTFPTYDTNCPSYFPPKPIRDRGCGGTCPVVAADEVSAALAALASCSGTRRRLIAR